MGIVKKMLLKLVVPSFGFAILTACVASQSSFQHRSFHAQTIQEGGLAIMGVVEANRINPSYQYLDWSKRLERSVVLENLNYPVVPALSIKKALGANYTAVLNGFQLNNELGSTEKDIIRRAPIIARYGLFARIERDHTELPRRQELPVKNARGEIAKDREKVVLSSRRTVTVSAKVYDFKTGQIVWQKTSEASPLHHATYINYRGGSFTGALPAATHNSVRNGSLSRHAPALTDQEKTLNQVY
jgi:hypothetical protein